jgi:antitoxin MazE
MSRASTSLAKWGSSLAVRIPKAILDAAQLKAGDALEIELHDGAIVIQAAANKPTLEQLVDAITPENCHPATDWGKSVGKEVW